MTTRRITIYIVVTIALAIAGLRACTRRSQPLIRSDHSDDNVWERLVNQTVLFEPSIVRVTPRAFTAYRIDPNKLQEILRAAPFEFTATSRPTVLLTLPRPDGTFGKFEVQESPVMEPALAKRFPMIKTYRARGVDDPTATARFEQTPHGLHAIVLSARGAYLVDAVGKSEEDTYVSYLQKDLPADPDGFECRTPSHGSGAPKPEPTPSAAPQCSPPPGPQPTTSPQADSDPPLEVPGIRRTYRLAIAASHRWVAAAQKVNYPNDPSGDPLQAAIEVMTRTIDRVNTIYERDVGIKLILVNNEPSIIHTDAATDPYDDCGDDDQLRDLNQHELDRRICPENYDVGQLFTSQNLSFGGSEPKAACSSYLKAQGLISSPNPSGDAFDLQYVAHEIAHEFGASHSFNGTMGGCCGNRNSRTAYEPGSGSTIMGYSYRSNAPTTPDVCPSPSPSPPSPSPTPPKCPPKSGTGLCGDETIQATPDPYFHAISIQEIRSFITSGGDICSQKQPTGDQFAPQVDAGQAYTIPANTPFALTVRSACDGDGDALTFTWEEFDRGPPDPPDPQDPNERRKKRPLFRSWEGSSNLTRIFPSLKFILNTPTGYIAESLPANNRTMVFRVTARDGRGLYNYSDVPVTVISKRGPADVGPFSLTAPATGAVWPRGSTQTINWSVNRTNLAPINCTSVRIVLLINSDWNNAVVLADNVQNNGTANVTLPSDLTLSETARLKIEAVGNIFFAISPADIRIVAQ